MNIKTISLSHVVLFLILLIAHISLFNYPAPIIFVGLLVVGTIYSSLLWIIGILSFLFKKESRIIVWLTAGLFTVTTSIVIIVFAIDYVGNTNWTTNFTLEYIIKYAKQLSYLNDNLPVPLYLIYILFTVFIALILFFYLKVSPIILLFINSLTTQIHNHSLSKKNISYLFLSFMMVPFFLYSYHATQSDTTEDLWDGEPITDLFLPKIEISLKDRINAPVAITDFNISNGKDIKDKPNIILIIADALRADHVSAYGYDRPTTPFLDKLIKDKKAIKVENAFSTCAESNCGILSTLDSRPYNEIKPNNINIQRVLKSIGYDINLILSTDHTWAGLKENYPPYDIFYDGNSAAGKFAMTDDELVIDRLSNIKKHDKPAFFYFHLMSNHQSGIRKKQFAKYTPYKNSNDWFYRLPIISSMLGTNKTILETNFYDNGIMQTDFYISQIFNQLSKKGYLKNSIVWIIADHGEALGEHGHYGHLQGLYNEETHIPMIIVDNKLELYKERYFSSQLDFAPTIVDRLGIEKPNSWKGRSLLKKKKGIYITHHNIPSRGGDKAIIVKTDDDKIYKMIYIKNPFKVKGVYDLSIDTAEKNNLNNTINTSLVKMLTSQLHIGKGEKQLVANHTM